LYYVFNICVFRQRNNKNLTVVHQYGTKDKAGRKMGKDKRRDKMMMLKSRYHDSHLNRAEEKPG
jgi:hypothetical protein